jgi:ElaB/YqjD/DUF883 family membrane-anchored ribosome-binding protein
MRVYIIGKEPMALVPNRDHHRSPRAYLESVMQEVLRGLGTVIEDAERLLRRFASEGEQCAGEALGDLRASVGDIHERFTKLEHRVQRKVRRRMRDTNRYAHENPWQMIGAAAAVAFVLGALSARRGLGVPATPPMGYIL